jgi:RND family efflux transporter MFP subunit
MRFVIPLLAVAVAGALAWLWLALPVSVESTTVRRGPLVEAVYATGIVEPVRWSKIASTETGRIVAYPAEEGLRVEAGDVLVRLDDRKARAALDELVSRVSFLEGELERYEYLVQRKTVSQQTYDRVLTDLDRARALGRVARQKLEDLTIRAPIDGVVIRKDGEIGEVVQAGDVLLWVGSEAPYWITANVDEEDIPRIAPGKTALIKADAYPGEVMEGTVGEITPMGDPVQKQYRVRILLPPDSKLMVGMTTEVNVVVREEDAALLVPEDALAGKRVWIVNGEILRAREVVTGVFGEGVVEIRDGLDEGERVVLEPREDFEDGQEVRVEDAP